MVIATVICAVKGASPRAEEAYWNIAIKEQGRRKDRNTVIAILADQGRGAARTLRGRSS